MLELFNSFMDIVEAMVPIQIFYGEGNFLFVHGYDFMIST